MKKNIKLIIGIIIAAVLMLLIGILVINSPAQRIKKQLELAERYMQELDYESAIVAYDVAISIDPMNADAYIGKAGAYIEMAKLTKDMEKALKYYNEALNTAKLGYEKTQAEELKELIGEITNIIDEYNKRTSKSLDEDTLYFDLGFGIEEFKAYGMPLYETSYEDYVSYIKANFKESIPGEEITQEHRENLGFYGEYVPMEGGRGINIQSKLLKPNERFAGDKTREYWFGILGIEQNINRVTMYVGNIEVDEEYNYSEYYDMPFKLGEAYESVLNKIGIGDYGIKFATEMTKKISTNFGDGTH